MTGCRWVIVKFSILIYGSEIRTNFTPHPTPQLPQKYLSCLCYNTDGSYLFLSGMVWVWRAAEFVPAASPMFTNLLMLLELK